MKRVSPGVVRTALITLSGLVLLYLTARLVLFDAQSDAWTVQVAVLSMILIIGQFGLLRFYFGTIYLFSNIFVISIAVFHLGYVVLDATGWQPIEIFHKGDMAVWYQIAGWYVCLAMASFLLGAAIGLRERGLYQDSPRQIDHNMQRMFAMGNGVLLASLCGIVLLIITVGNIFLYSRQQIYAGIGDTRGLGLVLAILPTGLVMLACCATTRMERTWAYACAFLATVLILFLGERSYVMFPLLTGAVIWHKLGRKIPKVVATVGIAVAVFIIPVISMLRSLGPYAELESRHLWEAVEHGNVKSAVMEVGGVLTLVGNVIRWVPEEEPYRFGETYVKAMLEIVPNVGLSHSRSTRAEAKKMLGGMTIDPRSLRPADWYIFKINRWMFAHGGGSGFSIIAEAYMNFGLAGVVFVFVMLGILLMKLDLKDLRYDYIALFCAIVFIWPLLKTVRNDILSFVKPVSLCLWTVLIWQLFSYFLPSTRRHMTVARQS